MSSLFNLIGVCFKCGVSHTTFCPRDSIKVEKSSDATCPYCGREMIGHAGPRSCEQSRIAPREADEKEKAAKIAEAKKQPTVRRSCPPPDNKPQ